VVVVLVVLGVRHVCVCVRRRGVAFSLPQQRTRQGQTLKSDDESARAEFCSKTIHALARTVLSIAIGGGSVLTSWCY